MNLKEIGVKMRNWAGSAQDRTLVNAALNLRVP